MEFEGMRDFMDFLAMEKRRLNKGFWVGLFALSLPLFSAQSASFPVDLFAALNSAKPASEAILAEEVLNQFDKEDLGGLLRDYIRDSQADTLPQSKNIAAESLARWTEKHQGTKGLLELSRDFAKLIAKKAVRRIIFKITKDARSQKDFAGLNSSERRRLIFAMLDSANSSDDHEVIEAVSQIASKGDARLILQDYSGNKFGEDLAVAAMARSIELNEGIMGVAIFAVRGDLHDKYTDAAVVRVRNILSSAKEKTSPLLMLPVKEKELLIDKLISSSREDNRAETIQSIIGLNRLGEVEPILRQYSATQSGVDLAAEAVVMIKEKSSNAEKALMKLSQDENPLIRAHALKRLQSKSGKRASIDTSKLTAEKSE